MDFYQQGRYIRAYESYNDDIIMKAQIKSESYYSLDNPIEQIKQYLIYFSEKSSSFNNKPSSINELWQAITEEAIDIFEDNQRINQLNKNDAYQILRTCLNDLLSYQLKLKHM